MSFKNKLKKIKNKLGKKKSVFSMDYLSNEEKTGVITGLVLLGAAAGYLLSSSSEAEACCVSGWNNAATPTGKNTHNQGWSNWGSWGSWSNWCRWSQHSNCT
ncbi:MAG: hypothetical protein DRN66_00565 [Candidatus Nanohalarchaeota archaeon]|nr:MAG: hypothetical protein DRN66_00565 [Candidatus Nanohaloarchaeota archaeon]